MLTTGDFECHKSHLFSKILILKGFIIVLPLKVVFVFICLG